MTNEVLWPAFEAVWAVSYPRRVGSTTEAMPWTGLTAYTTQRYLLISSVTLHYAHVGLGAEQTQAA